LNIDFIRRLHKEMFSTVWKWAGKFRKSDKNIGISSDEIAVEVQKLCDDSKAWLEFNTYPPDEFAARFHHRLSSFIRLPMETEGTQGLWRI